MIFISKKSDNLNITYVDVIPYESSDDLDRDEAIVTCLRVAFVGDDAD